MLAVKIASNQVPIIPTINARCPPCSFPKYNMNFLSFRLAKRKIRENYEELFHFKPVWILKMISPPSEF